MIDDSKVVQYAALGVVATFLFIGILLIVALDGMN